MILKLSAGSGTCQPNTENTNGVNYPTNITKTGQLSVPPSDTLFDGLSHAAVWAGICLSHGVLGANNFIAAVLFLIST